MPIKTRTFDVNPLYPAFSPNLAVKRPVKLPLGGTYLKGRVIARPTYAAAQSEVSTLSIGGSGTGGTFTVTFNAGNGANVSAALAYNVSTSAFKTALEAIFGTGNVAVTGTAGTSYVVTFQNMLANQRIYKGWSVDVTGITGGSPTGSWAYTTRGSCGEGQYDIYDDALSDGTQVARAILIYDYKSDPMGGRVTEHGISGSPFTPEAYFAGYFKCAQLLGLDANAVADLGTLVAGTAYSDPNAVLKF